MQADSIVQSPYDPQTLNRYAYCRNNPVKFVDPSGSIFGIDDLIVALVIIAASAIAGAIDAAVNGQNVLKGAAMGALSGTIGVVTGGVLSAAFNAAGAFVGKFAGEAIGKIVTIGLKTASVGLAVYGGVKSIQNNNFAAATLAFAGAAMQAADIAMESKNAIFNKQQVSSGDMAESSAMHSLNASTADAASNQTDPYVLTIKSNPGGEGSLDGHSWLEVENMAGEKVTLGTWGNEYGGQGVRGVNINSAGEIHGMGISRSMGISESQFQALSNFVSNQQALGGKGWTHLRPCSSFAARGWKVATGEGLSHRTWYGVSHPGKLAASISKANLRR